MKVALYGKSLSKDDLPLITSICHVLNNYGANLSASSSLHTLLKNHTTQLSPLQLLERVEATVPLDLMISLGGDGTLLEAVNYVGASETPVLGINIGRMGFLATVAKENAVAALDIFCQAKHTIDQRALLQVEVLGMPTTVIDFALNEAAFLKQNSSSMITVHASIDGELSTTYWADGLIVATPTGSTGYSLSCGGPIVLPSAHNLVVTPVSPHNLSVRPLVVPDSAVLSFRIESRNQKFLATLDGRSRTTPTDVELIIRKASFQTHLVRVSQSNIFDVLRQKLHWGLDVRN